MVKTYRTFDDLHKLLARHVADGGFDCIIHCAAVSDYLSAGIFSPAANAHFDADGRWTSDNAQPPRLENRAAGKVKSDEPELWLRLVRAPKLVDKIRNQWHFGGILVKFKLEVGVGDGELLAIAERSRQQSATTTSR